MKIESQKVTIRKIVAEDGYVFKQANGDDIYENVVYLSSADDPKNYVEITIEEAQELKEAKAE